MLNQTAAQLIKQVATYTAAGVAASVGAACTYLSLGVSMLTARSLSDRYCRYLDG